MFLAVIDSVPATFDIARAGTRTSITIPLAISDDTFTRVALEVRLWPGYWCGIAMHEFKFLIVVLDSRTGQPAELFDREEAAAYIEPVRHHVLPCVRAATQMLIETVRPRIIYRATYLTQPPRNALSKHRMITDTIVRLGYRVLQTGTDTSKRRFWLMIASGDA